MGLWKIRAFGKRWVRMNRPNHPEQQASEKMRPGTLPAQDPGMRNI